MRFKAKSLGGNLGEDKPDEGFIRSWKMVDGENKEIPVSFDVLVKMPKTVLDGIYSENIFPNG